MTLETTPVSGGIAGAARVGEARLGYHHHISPGHYYPEPTAHYSVQYLADHGIDRTDFNSLRVASGNHE
jgi:hypothetical protein